MNITSITHSDVTGVIPSIFRNVTNIIGSFDVTARVPNVLTDVTSIIRSSGFPATMPNVFTDVTSITRGSDFTAAAPKILTDVTNVNSGNVTEVSIFPSTLRSGCMEVSATRLLPCDHPENLVSRATRNRVDDVVYVGVLPLLVVLGVVVNVLNVAVFVAQGLKDRVTLCLFSLSIADLLTLTSLYLHRMNKTLVYIFDQSWYYNVWLTTLIRYRLVTVHAGFQLVSNFLSIVIALDRCLCVTWPLRAARALSTRMTGVVIVVFSVLVLAGIQFVAFKYDLRCAVITGEKAARSFWLILPSDLYKENTALMDILDSFVFFSLVPTLSLFVTATATAITAVKLRRATVWRDSAIGSGGSDVMQRKEKGLTRMLVVISCIYIACVSPRVIRSLCRFFVPEFRAWGRLCNLMMMTEALVNFLLAVNSTVNFFVYYAMGSRFRLMLRRLLTCDGRRLLKKKTDGHQQV